MVLKYDVIVNDAVICERLQNLINQVYKLLPSREQGLDWQKPLETIIEELSGFFRLCNYDYQQIFFPLLSKLQGLYSLTQEEDFSCYRRIIFECLGLINSLQKKLCQNQIY